MTTDELIERAAKAAATARRGVTAKVNATDREVAVAVLAVFEQAQAEPEWEYGTTCPVPECTEPHLLTPDDEPPMPEETLWRRTTERYVEAGPWVPVEATDE